jgi:hypothetical protein
MSGNRPSSSDAGSKPERLRKVYLLLFPTGKKKVFLLQLWTEEISVPVRLHLNIGVSENIGFMLQNFIIWMNFEYASFHNGGA